MSKFIDGIYLHQRGRVPLPGFQLMEAKSSFEEIRYGNLANAYDITVNVGYRSIVPPDGNLEDAMRRSRRAISEFVFGEFRQPIVEAMWEIDKGNAPEAHKRLEDVLRAMFEV